MLHVHNCDLLTPCSGHNAPAKEKNPPCSTPLSLEQSKRRPVDLQIKDELLYSAAFIIYLFIYLLFLNTGRVFVTYEADNDKHVNEIINFVALLRHNGFDTHVCTESFFMS